jgi:hypothetical protein
MASWVNNEDAGLENRVEQVLSVVPDEPGDICAPSAHKDDRKRISSIGVANRKRGIFGTVQYLRKPTPLTMVSKLLN